ncbi:endoribonuclease Dicer homolog 2-like isoform X1 [Prosopis cineraria]|uniref:endoribonuclease Dicer homolog 2-like isoform X1 n=1 Tax=Prosopis cineraria TaxID=364024 RepID=UPI002410A4AC|nr:endoribonuclease Dicer homolog 2-like isoform X1 [Prosopis cineraria]
MDSKVVEELVNESYNEEQPQYIPPELVNRFSHIDGNTVYHCYLIELKQDFTNDVSTSDVILATRCELDPEVIGLMEFKMCTNRGSLAVKFNYIGIKNLGLNEVLLCRRFQVAVFGILSGYDMAKLTDILNELCLEDDLEVDYLLLPFTTTHQRPFTIDWPSSQEGCNNHIANAYTQDGLVCSCELENSLVYTPHNGHFYIITGIMELDGNSRLRQRNGEAITYKRYYEEKYGIQLCFENQQLYNGRHIFQVQNYLLKNRQVKKRESTRASVELPPELCSIVMSPISASTIYSLSFIPPIIHRLESLLVASNLKKMCMQNDIPTDKILEAITTKECQESFDYDLLETLGDSFLKYITCQHLYQTYPFDPEGPLTEKKNKMISNASLSRLGCNSKLPGFIRSRPFDPKKWIIPGDRSRNVTLKEELVSDMTKMYVGGNRKMKYEIIADVVEALIGAFLSTGGEKAALKFMDWIGIKVEFEITPNKRLLNIDPERLVNVRFLESLLNYSFNDRSLLVEALTHSSYIQPEIPTCYQRLEFLGDSVLDFLITEHLYNKYPGLSPGLLTDMRSASVNNDCYPQFAIKAGLHKHIIHSSQELEKNIVKAINKFEESSTKPTFGWDAETYFPKVLADIIESLAGAIMVDSGFNKDIVFKSIIPLLEPLVTPETVPIQPVRELHELCQKQYYKYKKPLVSRSNDLTCVTVRVLANGKIYEKTSKAPNGDMAEKLACKELMTYLKKINNV